MDGEDVNEFAQHDGNEFIQSATTNLVESQMQRIESKVEQAIVDGYDGVDICYNRPAAQEGVDMADIGIKEITVWNRPAPEINGQYRVVRYSWEWFDNDVLIQAIEDGNLDELYDVMVEK